jgi:hypothetical protein
MMSTENPILDPGVQFSAALDPHRRAAYRRAIEQAFKKTGPNPSVALLGWQAATLIDVVTDNASRIVIIEEDEELSDNVHKGIVARGFGAHVEMVAENPATVKLDERVDIVVAGMTSTWFMEGPGARILANARENVLKNNGLMIPRRFVHLFELACSPTEINGISLRVPRHSRPGEPIPVLSESKHWATTDLTTSGGFSMEVEDTIIVYPLLSGTLTGLRLTTLAELGENTVHPAAHSGFQSVFVPLRQDLQVEAGEPVEIFVRYRLGDGFTETRFSARALQQKQPEEWEFEDHPVVDDFRQKVVEMIQNLDEQGRGQDLDKVVSYTLDPHGDVSRLAALFWTIDEEFRKPLRDLVDGFRSGVSQLGSTPSDEKIYEILLQTYRDVRA